MLEVLANLNSVEKEKNRLIEIAADGQITEDEYSDFSIIKIKLEQISMSVNALKLWVDKTIADGKIDKNFE